MAAASSKNWDLRRLQQHIAGGHQKNLYFLYGDEPYLIDESLRLLKEAFLPKQAADFNFDQFYASEIQGAQIRDSVEVLPMMAERRLVVVKQAHLLKEKDWLVLQPIIENPIQETVLIMAAEKVDKRKKYYKALAKTAAVVELKTPFDNQIPNWVQYIAGQVGCRLDDDAVALIHQLVGSNLSEIKNELEKLAQHSSEGQSISAKQVFDVVSRSRIDSIFELADAIGECDKAKALSILVNILDHGQNEVAALAMIARHVRILSQLKEWKRQGLTGPKLSQKVGIPQFFLHKYMSQAQKWDKNRLDRTTQALYETDRALKSSPVSSHIWLENFIIAST